jgi:hypothetical protein
MSANDPGTDIQSKEYFARQANYVLSCSSKWNECPLGGLARQGSSSAVAVLQMTASVPPELGPSLVCRLILESEQY